MNRPPPPPSLGEQLALAAIFWLVVTFFSIPLWDLAQMLFAAYRYGTLPSAVMESLLKPAGTIFGLMLLFGMHAEHGIESIISHYWPAFLISSALTVFLLRWWRRPLP